MFSSGSRLNLVLVAGGSITSSLLRSLFLIQNQLFNGCYIPGLDFTNCISLKLAFTYNLSSDTTENKTTPGLIKLPSQMEILPITPLISERTLVLSSALFAKLNFCNAVLLFAITTNF